MIDYRKFCQRCKHYDFDDQKGIICGLTAVKPAFENTCKDFDIDENREKQLKAHDQRHEDRSLRVHDYQKGIVSWPKIRIEWSEQFAYVCFLLCGLSALFLFLAIEFMDQGWAILLGILVGVPLFMASFGALAFGIIYSILHWRNWRLLLLSFLSILLILVLIAEVSPPIIDNVAGSIYGLAVTVLSSYWLFRSNSKESFQN